MSAFYEKKDQAGRFKRSVKRCFESITHFIKNRSPEFYLSRGESKKNVKYTDDVLIDRKFRSVFYFERSRQSEIPALEFAINQLSLSISIPIYRYCYTKEKFCYDDLPESFKKVCITFVSRIPNFTVNNYLDLFAKISGIDHYVDVFVIFPLNYIFRIFHFIFKSRRVDRYCKNILIPGTKYIPQSVKENKRVIPEWDVFEGKLYYDTVNHKWYQYYREKWDEYIYYPNM